MRVPRRILFVTELFHPSVGGMEARYKQLGAVFVQNGWSVDVLTIAHEPSSPERELVDGMSVLRQTGGADYKRPNSRLRRNPAAILRFALRVRSHIARHPYDLIVFNIWPLLPQVISRIPRGTVALVDWCEHRSSGFWPLINRIVSRSAPKHMSVSEGVKRTLTARYGISDIACVPSGIFTGNYRSSDRKSGVLFFGRLSPHKRPEEAIQAVIRARELGFEEHLTVAGGGPLSEPLRQRYGSLGFIRLLGHISDTEKIRLLSEHRIHLLPSEREGFPVAVAESMASGMPTITTSHPDNGTVDVVRQYGCGIVVEPGAESIAQAICQLTRDPSEWRRLSDHCRHASLSLDWQQVFAGLMAHVGIESPVPEVPV